MGRRGRGSRDAADDAGFIFVELVVVMVIVCALSAVAMIAVRGLHHRGEASACNADVRTVTTAADVFLALSLDSRPAPSLDALVRAGFLVADPGDVSYTPSATNFTAVATTGCS